MTIQNIFGGAPKWRAAAILLGGIILGVMLGACTARPVPTVVLETPTPRRTATASPTITLTPTPMPTATPTPTPTQTATPTLATTPLAFEHSSRAILIEADVWGGANAAPRDAHVPLFRLYGDGLVVFAGANAPLTSGLDAVPRVGRLSENEIQNLLAYFNQINFSALKDYYEPRPKPTDMPTAKITLYVSRVKTVQVYAPSHESTPQVFSDALKRILQTLPAESQAVAPSEGLLQTTDAGAPASLVTKEGVADWTIPNVRLAEATSGVTLTGGAYTQVVALRAENPNAAFYREGDRAYRVRFTPKLPRAVFLGDFLGTLLNAPREFDGRVMDFVGYYRGWNLYGEARGNPVTRSDWTLVDETGAIYVTGMASVRGLDPASRADAWTVIRLTAKVVYVRLGTSYLEARRVEILASDIPTATVTATLPAVATPAGTPTPITLATAEGAIAAVKARFPETQKIQRAGVGLIGGTTDIKVFDRGEGWELAFVEGSGDCTAGCINNRYSYFSVRKDGRVTKVGEYVRIYNESANAFQTTGVPMWGVPR